MRHRTTLEVKRALSTRTIYNLFSWVEEQLLLNPQHERLDFRMAAEHGLLGGPDMVDIMAVVDHEQGLIDLRLNS